MTFFFISLCLGIGVLAGFVSGLLGVGGGLIIVPLFINLFDRSELIDGDVVELATGTSLAIIFVTSIIAVLTHYKKQAYLNTRPIMLLSGGMVGAYLGRWLAHLLPVHYVIISFSLFLFFVAWQLMRSRPEFECSHNLSSTRLAGTGLLAGIVGALFGLGGGIVIVPVLYFYRVPLKQAIALSALTTCVISFTGVGQAIWIGRHFDLQFAIGYVYLPACSIVLATSMLMAPVGVKLAHRLPAEKLKPVFALFLVIIAVQMTYQILVN